MTKYKMLAVLLSVTLLGSSFRLSAQDANAKKLKVDHNNEILQVYIADEPKDGLRVLVFEMKDMKFYSNQSLYGCIFVNGRIVQIREYNREDSYVRGELAFLPDEKEIAVYSGVISSAPDNLDVFDYPPMWKAFTASEFKPFVSRISDLPKWYVSNPIQDKKRNEKAKEQK